ncbi:ABC transporter permease [Sinanaerobacter chloroacetimidivorans]|uniref:ABC transporter permease n=1 Tax=Sinanaerobacter chloroacetimidivorans TaxID=2818044 RepID=A0A8J8B0F3_9FIRM|nr:ABC transporter permease [Sinanaerobacter chloroacetimidivorans]MBR0596561.1 ABC transporter permease [Sinanaerobacter chloroacetimidivorans]
MDRVFELIISAEFLSSVLRVTTPILFATMAVLLSDRAGVLNISIEGTMLFAALMGVVGSAYTQSAWLGLLIAILSGVFYAGILSFFHLKLKTDIVLTGIALNLMASGLTVSILYILTGDKGVSTKLPSKVLPSVDIPFIENIPYIGTVFSGQNVLTYFSIIILIVLSIFLKYTRTGTHIRAVGEFPTAVETAGISVVKTRLIALLISGGIAGMGGAFMSMAYLSMFTKDMISGRGFIALAAEAMGRGMPFLSLLSSLLFGFADALSSSLQLFNIPSELTRVVPYLLTIIALGIYAARAQKKR